MLDARLLELSGDDSTLSLCPITNMFTFSCAYPPAPDVSMSWGERAPTPESWGVGSENREEEQREVNQVSTEDGRPHNGQCV